MMTNFSFFFFFFQINIYLAVESGQSEIVEALLGYGSNVHLKTEHTGETPLHIAGKK